MWHAEETRWGACGSINIYTMWHAEETRWGACGSINIYTMWHAEEKQGVHAVPLTFTQCGMLKKTRGGGGGSRSSINIYTMWHAKEDKGWGGVMQLH